MAGRGTLDPRLFESNLRYVFGLGYKTVPTIYADIFNTHTSDKAYEEDIGMIGLPTLAVKEEFGKIAEASFASGLVTRYMHVRYALGIRISHELMNDEKYGQTKKVTKSFGRITGITWEMLGMSPFNNAFDAAAPWNTDARAGAQPLCSKVHPLLGKPGSTWANRPAVDMDPSLELIQAYLSMARRTPDQRGLYVHSSPIKLGHAIDTEWLVAELLDSKDRPDTAERATNVVYGKLKPVLMQYLTDQDATFTWTGKEEHEMHWFTREAMDTFVETIAMTGGEKRGDKFFGCTARVSYGVSDPRGIQGCPGAG